MTNVGNWLTMAVGLAVALSAAQCAHSPAGDDPDASADRPVDAARQPQQSDAAMATADAGACSPVSLGAEPTSEMLPIPGELTMKLVHLTPGVTFRLAEAGIIVGPDGTLVLLDVGNSPHDDEIRDLVRYVNTQLLTPARGFTARNPLQVDWIVLTHVHGDHVGAINDLFINTTEPLQLTRGVIHRGFVDVGEGMNTGDYTQLCEAFRGPLADRAIALCETDVPPPCEFSSVTDPARATGCPGLLRGNLSRPDSAVAGTPSYIELGLGARLVLVAANGHVSNGTAVVPMAPFGHEAGDEENARSIAGIVEYGSFRYHFGGDLHGRPSDGPDVESHLIAVAGAHFYGDKGMDVVQAHHHARRTSSNETFVAAVAPNDGRSRNVVAGFNAAHLGSPFSEVVEAWTGDTRLSEGRLWLPLVTTGGASSSHSVIGDEGTVVQTIAGGGGYRIQSLGDSIESQAFSSVRSIDCAGQ